MSLYESGDSNGEVNSKALSDGETEVDAESALDIERLAFIVCHSGWPQAVNLRDIIALDQAMVRKCKGLVNYLCLSGRE